MSLALAIASASSVNGNQAGDRAEDFFLGDAHAVVDIGEDGRQDEVAVLHARRHVGRREAAAEHRRAFLAAELDVAADLGEVRAADHRTDDRLLVQRVADDDPLRALGEFRGERRIRLLLDQHSAAGGAALAVVAEDHEQRRIERAVEVGVVEDDEWALAAELHAELLQPRGLDDAVAGHAVDPVNEIAATSRWRQSGSPASLPVPCTRFRTPAGIPASSASSPRRAAVIGDSRSS